MEFLLQQLSDIEYRVVQIKRRIAELKEQLTHTSSNVQSDQKSESETMKLNRDQSSSTSQSESYKNQRASELDSLKLKLMKPR
jgi:predicted  nucleic acid-binding Zn-ribbon protein